ncbi:hypothetical protein HYT01_01305 [Candidatus Giovannonibacteria bacterium]|nr:hypothetical protein [Candidatus Giovannonibacteria bacterium]
MRLRRFYSIAHVLILSLIIFFIAARFIHSDAYIGPVLIILAILSVVSFRVFSSQKHSITPDIIFGIIDNGFLAAFAIFGGEVAGVAGAVIGGVVGNAITDGIAGIFEGYWAERSTLDTRTILGSSIGKMAGCLFGAGAVLSLFYAAGF